VASFIIHGIVFKDYVEILCLFLLVFMLKFMKLLC